MATIGGALYATAVHEFFDGLRSYDAERACAVLADDADLQSPWNQGVLTGKDAIQEVLGALVSNPGSRPSFTIQDIRGDGNVVRLDVAMSARFGAAPVALRFHILHLRGTIHQVVIEGRNGARVPAIPSLPVDLATPAPEPKPPVAAEEPVEATEPAPAKPAKAAAKPKEAVYMDYAGDVDDVIDIEGIGPVYAKKLADIGIHTTARLCWESNENIEAATGAKPGTVAGWKAMAQLMKVNGIGGQYAEILYRGGVTGIPDLQEKEAVHIAGSIAAYLDTVKTTVQKNKITAKRINGWKKTAAGMTPEALPIPEE